MKSKSWTVDLDGVRHAVELHRAMFADNWSVTVDGREGVARRSGKKCQLSFDINGHPCMVTVQRDFAGAAFDLVVDGRSMTTGGAPAKLAPIPAWAWAFIIACGIIPIITLGGAIPAGIGGGGAFGCAMISRNASLSEGVRALICVAVTAVCWVLFALLLMVVASSR